MASSSDENYRTMCILHLSSGTRWNDLGSDCTAWFGATTKRRIRNWTISRFVRGNDVIKWVRGRHLDSTWTVVESSFLSCLNTMENTGHIVCMELFAMADIYQVGTIKKILENLLAHSFIAPFQDSSKGWRKGQQKRPWPRHQYHTGLILWSLKVYIRSHTRYYL